MGPPGETTTLRGTTTKEEEEEKALEDDDFASSSFFGGGQSSKGAFLRDGNEYEPPFGLRSVESISVRRLNVLDSFYREEEEDDPDKKNILQIIRRSYSLHLTRTILCGATLTATLQELSLWGSLFKGDYASDHVMIMEDSLIKTVPPVEPARECMQYIGAEQMFQKAFRPSKYFSLSALYCFHSWKAK